MNGRTAECCHPSSVILAVITMASHMNLKEGSPLLKALDGMLLRVKSLSESVCSGDLYFAYGYRENPTTTAATRSEID